MKKYKGEYLSGKTLITYKIDGVQCIIKDGVAKSRAGKPLYNVPELPDGTYEIYAGDWSSSISACRTQNGKLIDLEHIYRIDKHIDLRLVMRSQNKLDEDGVGKLLKEAIKLGYEGLVLRYGDEMYKVKPVYTYDVVVTGLQEGTGRNKGRLGAFLTPKGKVGTGLTDKDRVELFNEVLIGTIIEVEVMELTPKGKFRHPRFVRLRSDK